MSAPRKRRLGAKLLALGFSCVMGALGVELVARVAIREPVRLAGQPLGKFAFHESLFSPATDEGFPPYYTRDPELGFRLVANVDTACPFAEAPNGTYRLRTNALGIRDDRPLDAKRGKRVLVLGDSMTYGLGVEREQAFAAHLEKKLSKEGSPVEVVNVGCCMWGQREEDAFLEHRGAALAPDVVLLQFTVANDVLDDLRYGDSEGTLVPDANLAPRLSEHPVFTLPFFAAHSRAYRALVWQLGRHAVRYRAMEYPENLERAAALVRRARDLSTKLGARFAFVVAPTAAQLEHSLADRILGTKKINDFMLAAAEKDGIRTCDPSVHLQAVYARGRSPYFAIDRHWNEDGHEAVASALEPIVQELLK